MMAFRNNQQQQPRCSSSAFKYKYSNCIILLQLFLFASFFTSSSSAFNLFIGTEEMNRTLGISARMDYVTNGLINEYSTRFPYRVAENISQIRFTWNSGGRTVRYSLRAVSEQFDVLPVLLVPSEGVVPRKSQSFRVEYRCVGARSGQFQVLLHFNISLRPPLQFTLKQEKICSYIDGRRAFAGEDDQQQHSSTDSVEKNNGGGGSSLLGQLLQLPLFCQLLFLFVLLLLLLCSLLFCCCYCLRAEDNPKSGSGGGQQQFLHSAMDPQQSAFQRRSKIGSIYASTRSSIRMKLNRSTSSKTRGGLAVSFGSPAQSGDGGGGGTHATRTTSSLANSSVAAGVEDAQQPFLNHQNSNNPTGSSSSAVDPQMPSTSTAPFPTGNSLLPPKAKGQLDRVVFERPEAQLLDVNQALIDLNADRNLFEQAPRPEMEGQFSQLVWASWRQIGATGNRPVVDEVDDEEDDAKEDKAIICKTLKPGAGRVQFERFLRNALQFHHVPSHSHLSQVIAAATFGNFRNPETVKDLPLISYAHDGFGLLKLFLQTCRGLPHNKDMDQVSIAAHSVCETSTHGGGGGGGGPSAIRGTNSSRDVLREGSSSTSGSNVRGSSAVPLQEGQKNPRIVVTNTASSPLSETTLRTHDLVSMGIQIVSAVRHLHKFGIIHKDIATRNCLVSRALLPLKFGSERLRLHVQLCDSALSRDFFPEDYALPPNCNNPEEAEPWPVRWMAPELLKNPLLQLNAAAAAAAEDGQQQRLPPPPPPVTPLPLFNSATDIWAFGVLLWELFTCGQQPYGEMHADELAQAIVYAGLRLPQPYNCPDEVYDLMCQCWSGEPERRQTATELDLQLQEFMNRLRKYI